MTGRHRDGTEPIRRFDWPRIPRQRPPWLAPACAALCAALIAGGGTALAAQITAKPPQTVTVVRTAPPSTIGEPYAVPVTSTAWRPGATSTVTAAPGPQPTVTRAATVTATRTATATATATAPGPTVTVTITATPTRGGR